MNFKNAARCIANSTIQREALDWYCELVQSKDRALITPPPEGDLDSIPPEYESAINWYNIEIEEHIPNRLRPKFAKYVGIGWGSGKTEELNNVLHWRVLDNYNGEYQERLCAKGHPISDSAINELQKEFLISFILEKDLFGKIDNHSQTKDSLSMNPKNKKDRKRIIEKFLGYESPIVWFTAYEKIKDELPNSEEISSRKIGSRIPEMLGMLHWQLCRATERKVYAIKVKLKNVRDKFCFPTIADARFYHVFEPASENQDFGMTIDLGNGQKCLPEVVLKRKLLKEIYESGEIEINCDAFELSKLPKCNNEYLRNRIRRIPELAQGVN